MRAGRGLLVAVVVLPLAFPSARPGRPARAPADSCATTPIPRLDSLVAAGRYWHAWRALAALPRAARPVPAREAVLRIRIGEGLERWREVDTILARVPGADTIP